MRNRRHKPITYRVDENGCHVCTSHAPGIRGYPHVSIKDVRCGLHRYIWEQTRGRKIPSGMVIHHTCDNPTCINPLHLHLGTQAENMQDAARKGRIAHTRACGEAHGNHKLTETDVIAIRHDKTSTQRELGRRYGVDHGQIGQIKRGESWKYLNLQTA